MSQVKVDYEKIDLLINVKGTSRRKIAQMLGVPENTFAAAFRRGSKMKLDHVWKIADYFGVQPSELLVKDPEGLVNIEDWEAVTLDRAEYMKTAEKMLTADIAQLLSNLNGAGMLEAERYIMLLQEIPRFQK